MQREQDTCNNSRETEEVVFGLGLKTLPRCLFRSFQCRSPLIVPLKEVVLMFSFFITSLRNSKFRKPYYLSFAAQDLNEKQVFLQVDVMCKYR